MAPAATILNVAVSYVDADGRDRYGFALVPTASRGVVFHDDWDALGMRASASGSITFEDVRVGPAGLRDGFPAGTHSAALLDRYLVSGAFHAAASLGIAESAHASVVTALRARRWRSDRSARGHGARRPTSRTCRRCAPRSTGRDI